jgi:hypothetical protein
MTDKWKLTLGRRAFTLFINGLNAFKARNVVLGERDMAIPPFHRVSRGDMLDRFLATRPDLEGYRAQFDDVYSTLSEFCVDTSKWNTLAPA